MAKARVVLRKAKTYQLGGKRWIKDVPMVVRGEENVAMYKSNGYFHVTMIKDKSESSEKSAKKKKSKKSKSGSKSKKKAKLKK